MALRDLKYLLAYLIPLVCLLGLNQLGNMTWGTVFLIFVLIPVVEPILGSSSKNLALGERARVLKSPLFDRLLYLNIPIVYGILIYFFWILNTHSLLPIEYLGLILSVGIVLGSCGINVAHELGHRHKKMDHYLAQLLLLPSWYMQFFIEHNRGHHKNVATALDPASARKNETLYAFWWRSVSQSYWHAWQLEFQRLSQKNHPLWSIQNQMLRFSLAQFIYLGIILILSANWYATAAMILAGVVGFLLLETINYIEHYGLQRKRLPSGRYEKVSPAHSWNANQEVGRILLYELTRHSDHHHQASKKYQVLDHREDAPQLPFGYPTAMLLSFIPPLWFWVMNQRLPKEEII